MYGMKKKGGPKPPMPKPSSSKKPPVPKPPQTGTVRPNAPTPGKYYPTTKKK